MSTIYIVRTLDTYDREWIVQVAAMTLEDAKLAQSHFAKQGSQTNVLPVRVWPRTSGKKT